MLWSKELFLMPSQNAQLVLLPLLKCNRCKEHGGYKGCLPANRLLTTVVLRIIVHPPKGYFRCFCFLAVG